MFGKYPHTKYSDSIERRLDKGIGCPSQFFPGWADLLNELDQKLATIKPDYVIHQIKEKFGYLCYYTDVDLEGEKLIIAARKAATLVCSNCGGVNDAKDGRMHPQCANCLNT